MDLLQLLPGAISQGIIWSIMALGVYITYRILDYADLTVDGSFALGGAVAASLIVVDVNPYVAVMAAIISGMLAGAITGFLHTKLNIPGLLAGILSMIALYSINLRVMGKANISLLRQDTIFTFTESMGINSNYGTLLVGLVFTLIVGIGMYWFFGTEIGFAIRATGNNEQMIRAQGVNTDITKILGLMLSNALVAMSGAMVCQSQGFADVGMGTGTIIIGLASVIIGEVLFGTRSFKNALISVVLGSIVYRIIISIVLWMGMEPNDLKIFTAIIVAAALSLPLIKNAINSRFADKEVEGDATHQTSI